MSPQRLPLPLLSPYTPRLLPPPTYPQQLRPPLNIPIRHSYRRCQPTHHVLPQPKKPQLRLRWRLNYSREFMLLLILDFHCVNRTRGSCARAKVYLVLLFYTYIWVHTVHSLLSSSTAVISHKHKHSMNGYSMHVWGIKVKKLDWDPNAKRSRWSFRRRKAGKEGGNFSSWLLPF